MILSPLQEKTVNLIVSHGLADSDALIDHLSNHCSVHLSTDAMLIITYWLQYLVRPIRDQLDIKKLLFLGYQLPEEQFLMYLDELLKHIKSQDIRNILEH